MNQTIKDSEICFRGISIETREQREKGDVLKVIAAGEKTTDFLGLAIEVEAKDAVLTKNDEIITNNGTIKFNAGSYKAIENNRKARRVMKVSEGIEK